MQPVTLNDIDTIYEYERKRPDIRPQMIALRKQRSVRLGPHLLVTFENRDTVRYYIQEAARAERLLREEALQHLIEEYNALLPDKDELSATLYLRIKKKEDIQTILHLFEGIAAGEKLWFECNSDEKIPGDFAPSPATPQPVYHLKFQFDSGRKKYLLGKNHPVSLVIDHASYHQQATIPSELRDVLLQEL